MSSIGFEILDAPWSGQQAKLDAMLKKVERELGGTVAGAVVRTHAYAFGYDLTTVTQPTATRGDATQAKALAKMEGIVKRDIGRAYLSAGFVYSQIAKRSKDQARAFMGMLNRGQVAEAQTMLRRLKISGLSHHRVMAWDGGKHHQSKRTGRRGGVRSGAIHSAVIVADQRALREYTKKIQQRVFLAKAGWVKGREKLLAGANAVRVKGGRRVPVPASIRRHLAKVGGGVEDDTRGGKLLKLVWFNNAAPWISQIFSEYSAGRAGGFRAGQLSRDLKEGSLEMAKRLGLPVGRI